MKTQKEQEQRSGRAALRRRVLGAMASATMLVASTTYAADSVSYTYDALGRIITVVYIRGATTTTITYSYDALGNRTSVVTTTP